MNNFLSFSTKGNSRRKVLTEEVMKQEHNLLCYSKNLAMTDYKDGYASEWSNSKEKVQLFSQLLKEQPDENGISYYYGVLHNWYYFDNSSFGMVEIHIENPECTNKNETPILYFKVPSKSFMSWKKEYFEEKRKRDEKELPDVVRIQVKHGTVYDIMWVNSWE